jgi:hypothetical protein
MYMFMPTLSIESTFANIENAIDAINVVLSLR